MQLLKLKSTISFMSLRVPAMIFSGLLVLASLFTLATNSLNWGLDFTGGTLVEVGYDGDANIPQIRAELASAGFEDAVVQNFGSSSEVLIRLAPREGVKAAQLSEDIKNALNLELSNMRRVEFVGPSVGEELTEQGGLAMLVALLCILV